MCVTHGRDPVCDSVYITVEVLLSHVINKNRGKNTSFFGLEFLQFVEEVVVWSMSHRLGYKFTCRRTKIEDVMFRKFIYTFYTSYYYRFSFT